MSDAQDKLKAKLRDIEEKSMTFGYQPNPQGGWDIWAMSYLLAFYEKIDDAPIIRINMLIYFLQDHGVEEFEKQYEEYREQRQKET